MEKYSDQAATILSGDDLDKFNTVLIHYSTLTRSGVLRQLIREKYDVLKAQK